MSESKISVLNVPLLILVYTSIIVPAETLLPRTIISALYAVMLSMFVLYRLCFGCMPQMIKIFSLNVKIYFLFSFLPPDMFIMIYIYNIRMTLQYLMNVFC